MSRPKKAAEPTLADLASKIDAVINKNAELERENAQLRESLEAQTSAKAMMQTRLAAQNPIGHQQPWTELMVGIRNVSDNTIGIKGAFGNADLQLNADLGTGDPGCATMVSYAWYREIRKGREFRNGMIVRDDSVLGPGFSIAPPDRDIDLPAEHARNIVHDPVEWIESRDEAQIRADFEAMTSEESMQRLRRAVDDKLRALESTQERKTVEEQVKAANYALRNLPTKYALIDSLVTIRLEKLDQPDEDAGPIIIKR